MNPGSSAFKGLETASAALIEPILIARQANNAAFLNTYSQVLLATLPKLLKNHLLARIEAMIILAQTAARTRWTSSSPS